MANWSNESHWFGILPDRVELNRDRQRLADRNAVPVEMVPEISLDRWYDYQGELQRMLANLVWQPIGDYGWPYRFNSIGNAGPALCISGEGKYGAALPLAESSWEFFKNHVVVFAGHSGFEDHFHHRITIAGEVVYERRFHMFEGTDDTSWKYVGRTPEERHFFERLLPFLNKGKPSRMEILAGALAGDSPEEGEALS